MGMFTAMVTDPTMVQSVLYRVSDKTSVGSRSIKTGFH